MEDICKTLAATRPTAVNLFWAIERMRDRFDSLARAGRPVAEIKASLIDEAQTMHAEDIAACISMGKHGAALLPRTGGVLTHCNAGALATCGYGTALGVIRAAVEAGARIKDGIPTTVIADNMAGVMMQQGKVGAVIVGADRIAANGDVANKIGTYSVAILAKEHGIPFYVAAPWSTIDLATPSGDQIPIEQRPAREVTHMAGKQITPDSIRVENPAFDVTPHRYVAAIITERGVAKPEYSESLAQLADLNLRAAK
jgi:methylthioribose-1-phosphate isomerase